MNIADTAYIKPGARWHQPPGAWTGFTWNYTPLGIVSLTRGCSGIRNEYIRHWDVAFRSEPSFVHTI